MNTAEPKPNSNPYSARNMAKPVNFYVDAPKAKTVHLAGDFSDWSPLTMQRVSFIAKVSLFFWRVLCRLDFGWKEVGGRRRKAVWRC